MFVNSLALQTITDKASLFPEGSILVREKFAKTGDQQPELLAVMIKRQKGFNAVGGDWEFMLINGSMTKVKLRQKKGDCLDCHQSQLSTDYVHPLIVAP